MPYLDARAKTGLDLGIRLPHTAGELNYALTMVCTDFLERHEGRYADYATIVGALECAKLEFYRRALAVYEDEAIERNGDVYGGN